MAGVDYSRQLTADSAVALSAGVDHYSNGISVVPGRNFPNETYYHAAGEYSRNIGRRLFAGANVSARKLAGGGANADVSGSLFIRYRLGDVK